MSFNFLDSSSVFSIFSLVNFDRKKANEVDPDYGLVCPPLLIKLRCFTLFIFIIYRNSVEYRREG